MSEEATEHVVTRLMIAGAVLPDAAELSEYISASSRDEATAPIFHPSAYQRGRHRLRALRDVAAAAARFRKAYDRLQAVAADESDPEADRAAVALLKAERRRMLEQLGESE